MSRRGYACTALVLHLLFIEDMCVVMVKICTLFLLRYEFY